MQPFAAASTPQIRDGFICSTPKAAVAAQRRWQPPLAAAPAGGSGAAGLAEGLNGRSGAASFIPPSPAAPRVPAARRLGAKPAPAATAVGGSGAAEFGIAAGKSGSTSFGRVAEPVSVAAAPVAAGAAEPAALKAQGDAEDAPDVDTEPTGGFWSLARWKAQLQNLGLAGVAAYGIFNTLYYVCAFLFFWVYVVKVPVGQGWAATAKAFAGVMAGVWAGSQMTKAPRAAAALMLAPLVDRAMDALQKALKLRTRRAVFLVFVAACLSLAATLFSVVLLAWS